MYSFVILELYLQPVFQSTLDTCTCSGIGQEVDGIAEKEIVAGHRCTVGNVLYLQAIRQDTRTMYFNTVIKNKDTDGSIPVE